MKETLKAELRMKRTYQFLHCAKSFGEVCTHSASFRTVSMADVVLSMNCRQFMSASNMYVSIDKKSEKGSPLSRLARAALVEQSRESVSLLIGAQMSHLIGSRTS